MAAPTYNKRQRSLSSPAVMYTPSPQTTLQKIAALLINEGCLERVGPGHSYGEERVLQCMARVIESERSSRSSANLAQIRAYKAAEKKRELAENVATLKAQDKALQDIFNNIISQLPQEVLYDHNGHRYRLPYDISPVMTAFLERYQTMAATLASMGITVGVQDSRPSPLRRSPRKGSGHTVPRYRKLPPPLTIPPRGVPAFSLDENKEDAPQ